MIQGLIIVHYISVKGLLNTEIKKEINKYKKENSINISNLSLFKEYFLPIYNGDSRIEVIEIGNKHKEDKNIHSMIKPLSQCGLIINHYLNIDGMAPAQAEQEISILKEQFSDETEKNPIRMIRPHFAFYKEYWISVNEIPSRIEINII